MKLNKAGKYENLEVFEMITQDNHFYTCILTFV